MLAIIVPHVIRRVQDRPRLVGKLGSHITEGNGNDADDRADGFPTPYALDEEIRLLLGHYCGTLRLSCVCKIAPGVWLT